MVQENTSSRDSAVPIGLWAGIAAYTIWGVFPVYFKATEQVSALEILAHRIVWSVPFGLLIIAIRSQFPAVRQALTNPKTVLLLTLAAISLAINWGIYIWAIQIDQIFQGSLGYYINPLFFVIVGVFFFKETLTRLQTLAVIFATIGVGILTIYGGVFPWISLSLAFSFGLYGLIRKQVDVGAMPGLRGKSEGI